MNPRGKGTVRFAVSAPFEATNQSKYRGAEALELKYLIE